jgi:glycosyltransferase involved in cell wall biosynthesis
VHLVRQWDAHTANSVDVFVANSNFVARRIRKFYRRNALVVYPPVDVDAFLEHEHKSNFYITASRLVPYKRVDLLVAAFAKMPTRQLVVIGDGPERHKIAALAKGSPNIQLLGFQPNHTLVDYMRRAKAFIFAAEEDFGITPVEAQACGTPVIAFGRGGALETIRGLGDDSPTGAFFYEQTVESVIDAVDSFELAPDIMLPSECRANAERFSAERFRSEFADLVEREWRRFDDSKKTNLPKCST